MESAIEPLVEFCIEQCREMNTEQMQQVFSLWSRGLPVIERRLATLFNIKYSPNREIAHKAVVAFHKRRKQVRQPRIPGGAA
jgi:hypothetical protein